MEDRICSQCYLPLAPDEHGNKKMHTACAYRAKKRRQNEKYQVGNVVKLKIQKNEVILARIHKQDPYKLGVHYIDALEAGLKFDCPSLEDDNNKTGLTINFFDQYGYCLKQINGTTMVIAYHKSEI